MSLSWIRNISIAEINSKRMLGIVFGRTYISAISTVQSNKNIKVDWRESVELDKPLFMQAPDSTDINNVSHFIKIVSDRINNNFVRAQIFLPDPLALFGLYKIDSIPNSPAQCRELACWRIKKQFHAQDKELVCDYQLLGEEGNKKLLMAVAMDAVWLKCIQDMLHEYGIPASVIDTNISHHYNQLENTLKQESGALIDVSPDYWSVIAWDTKGRPRFIRSRWRNVTAENYDGDLEEVAREIMQSLLIYSHQDTYSQINNIFIFGNENDQAMLGNRLNHYMTQEVQYIDIPDVGVEHNRLRELSELQAKARAAVVPR